MTYNEFVGRRVDTDTGVITADMIRGTIRWLRDLPPTPMVFHPDDYERHFGRRT